ncbi:C-terminal helicase domain-containing protein [Kamptonema sp. UHCC 0994]|uniref:C-terminal helicase domain-containing protein n=1 Tax=Kamptonema sp. UHCC 0994 TaxID=3031329 RepID=UPI0023BA796B|nr:C-terminal helicase domain-containing protein [Kamptonema sp. UHCC 0994]MDF0556428.1 C-terminal helicase domain-containing protein [Kamptonema sp. UHCC 0994]
MRQAFDKTSSKQDSSLEDFHEIQKSLDQQRWLLIIDESHEFRNRFKQDLFNMKKQPSERQAFIRLREFCKKGKENLKVLLLTGSPYARDIENINNQLFLLPHTAESHALLPDYVDDARAWKVTNASEFVQLPVASQLTTPHVAKYYGQQEGQDIYIKFGENSRYIPKVKLHTIIFPLIFDTELTDAILNGCFDVNSRNPMFREVFKRAVKIAWASSPLSLQGVLERVSDTPGGSNAYELDKLQFTWSRQQRQSVLKPLIDQLKKFDESSDVKLQALSSIIQKAQTNSQKIIIFCERHATVVYLRNSLKKLLPSLQITATIESNNDSQKLEMKETKEIEKLIKQFAPIANAAEGEYEETYDVFISTDAHGVGVNMQDASIAINYDIDWTPIGPTQRAGRILRFWHLPRTIEVYAFVPTLTSQTNLQYDLVEIQKRWKNLMVRHQESSKLIDLPVLTIDPTQEINLTEMASRTTIQSGELNLEALADADISPYYQHTAQLQLNRRYAEGIADDIVSAKTYSGETHSVYILLLHNKEYYGVFYNPLKLELREPNIVNILDVIACHEETEIANVDYDEVEKLSHSCIQAWCEKHNAKWEDVERICVLYLKPEKVGDDLADLFT